MGTMLDDTRESEAVAKDSHFLLELTKAGCSRIYFAPWLPVTFCKEGAIAEAI
jgi:hypothetical protein